MLEFFIWVVVFLIFSPFILIIVAAALTVFTAGLMAVWGFLCALAGLKSSK